MTRDEAIAALREWMAREGRQPTYNEWRCKPGGQPSRDTLRVLFGGWSAAMAAAGGVPRGQGEYDREAQRVPWRKCGVCGRRFRLHLRYRYCSAECGGISTARAAYAQSARPYRGKSMKALGGRAKAVHRDIAERWLGRYLARDEVVHHIDGNTRNNRIANLAVLGNSAHTLLHCYGGPVTALDGTVYVCTPDPDRHRGLVVSVAESFYAARRGRSGEAEGEPRGGEGPSAAVGPGPRCRGGRRADVHAR